MFDHKEKNIHYKVYNIITDKEFIFNDDLLYPDDTNKMIINKIINYCYPDISTSVDEIYAYSNSESICFEYDNISNMNHIIKDNKLTDLIPDPNFVNELGIQKVVKMTNKMNKLFEQNNLSDNTIYYFCLRDIFNTKQIDLMKKPDIVEFNSKLDIDLKTFYNGIIRKFFPRINENNIKNYPSYNKRSEKEYIDIKNNRSFNNPVDKINKI